MQKSTIYYQFKKMLGIEEAKQTNSILVKGLAETFEPSLNSINTIMAFSHAYRHNKSDMIDEIEYMVN